MKYSFPKYLLSKQTVDDRALNKDVLSALKENLPQHPLRIIEVGAGIGTMLRRLIRWDIVQKAEYVLVDEMAENIDYASAWINDWAKETGLKVERSETDRLHLYDNAHDIHIQLKRSDVFDFIQENKTPADLLIAHAFLDLLPMPESMTKLLSLIKDPSTSSGQGLAWLTINFDGVTTFEPTIDAELDEKIEQLYHETMNTRPTGGDSKSGRHLFEHLRKANAEILEAGASDWVVYSNNGRYPYDEDYFLKFILHFFEESLTKHPDLNQNELADWINKRRTQIEHGELTYIAHQMDFLVRV